MKKDQLKAVRSAELVATASRVTLPPFPWATEARVSGSERTRTARPGIERGTVEDGSELSDAGREASVIEHRARVWRTKLPDVMTTLNTASRAAVLDFATTVETVSSSGGTSDPTGGGTASARGPSLRAISAAERLRHMMAALADGVLEVPLKDARRIRRGPRTVRVPLSRVAEWVAVDGMNRGEILQRLGAANSSTEAQNAVVLAIRDIGDRLAICCGYVEPPHAHQKKRNAARRAV